MNRRLVRLVLGVLCFGPALWSSTIARADASFLPEADCDDQQIQILQMWTNQALDIMHEGKYQAQYERWFGPVTGEKLGQISNVATFVLETLQVANLGSAARVALGLAQTSAQPLRIHCNGFHQEDLAHKSGADEITIDVPFWNNPSDSELASYDSHAGTILHEITHLAGIGHLPGCNGGSFTPAQCFDRALEFAANDDPSIMNSAQNYEYFFMDK